MPPLVGFGKIVSSAYNTVVKDVQGYVLCVAASIKVYGVRHISR